MLWIKFIYALNENIKKTENLTYFLVNILIVLAIIIDAEPETIFNFFSFFFHSLIKLITKFRFFFNLRNLQLDIIVKNVFYVH